MTWVHILSNTHFYCTHSNLQPPGLGGACVCVCCACGKDKQAFQCQAVTEGLNKQWDGMFSLLVLAVLWGSHVSLICLCNLFFWFNCWILIWHSTNPKWLTRSSIQQNHIDQSMRVKVLHWFLHRWKRWWAHRPLETRKNTETAEWSHRQWT